MKDFRSKINYLFNKYIFVFFIVIGLCPMLAVSYATFSINTQGYRSNEMYISELLYSIKIDNENTYTIDIEPGRKEHTIEITSLNAISTNYKLAYLNNSDLEVVYASDYLEPSFGGITTTRTISLMITNNSSETKTLSLMVFGGYGFNSVDNIEVLNTYTEIKLDYYHYDYETTALYVDNVLVDKLDEEKDYTLESYTCTNGSEVEYDTDGKKLIITGGSKTKCSLYFKEGDYSKIKYSQIAANYSCANSSNGSNPVFTYTGNCIIIDENNGDWKIKLLTSGNLTFKRKTAVDVFLVGGGGGGAGDIGSYHGGNGGGGGYTKTYKNISLESNFTVKTQVGAGGAGGETGVAGSAGSMSYFISDTYSAQGGTGGGATGTDNKAGDGGSGGGVGGVTNGGTKPTVGGSDGSDSTSNVSWITPGKGQGTTTREFGETLGDLYAGGGTGGCLRYESDWCTRYPGGAGGGGNGGGSDGAAGSGEENTGGGGGGGTPAYGKDFSRNGGNGGSGIVIIRNAR